MSEIPKYVAAKLSDYAGRQTRARRSVAKEAWAELWSPFRGEICTASLMLTRMGGRRTEATSSFLSLRSEVRLHALAWRA
jgi:hypothetical protein